MQMVRTVTRTLVALTSLKRVGVRDARVAENYFLCGLCTLGWVFREGQVIVLHPECVCITSNGLLPVPSNKLKGLNGTYLGRPWETAQ